MSSDLTEKTLKAAVEIKDIVSGDGVISQTGEVFAKLFSGTKTLVAVDENTFSATGEEVIASLRVARVEFAQRPHIFPGKPTLYSDCKNAETPRKHIESLEGTVVCSIGVGTLSNIAELASGELGRPYMNVYAAASTDGFTAFGASISRNGFRITRSCPGPAGPVADNDVVCNASKRLTTTGHDDLIERIPAGADWILADALGVEPINEYVWNMVQGPLHGSLAGPEAIGNGDKRIIEGLMKDNLMSGPAMQAGQSSHSVFGADHQFSHVWEMEDHGLDWEPPLSRGFKTRVGTVASYTIWEKFLKMEAEDSDVDRAFAAVKSPEQVEFQVCTALKPRI